ncbi:amidase [Streptomyces sp. NBC_01306]|uniref:amidase n=1 Tax=Streptomyces sp. NBC_01306 TaxID=2903819 RepID=UPI00225BA5CB|nr:amidase [Streptomyces sp. NBC_01306]MCX4724185.1 amidase [Streptomyces sp. NBC_01306]
MTTNHQDGPAPHVNDIVLLQAVELSKAIHARRVSCEEVMTAYLDHIEGINPTVNAIVSLRPREELLREAVEKDRLLAQGRDMGWMHGFPHAVKDTADAAGFKTTRGFFHGRFDLPAARTDSLHIARIRAAGAIFIGKTNVPEFGLGSHTYNDAFGLTRNAYHQGRSAGGSSGGAAVAVALHMLPVADGSDFMGSLRNPAAWNNVLGLRPSFGRVPMVGPDVFVQQGAIAGPLARTATDLALLLETMSGYDPRAPLSLEPAGTLSSPLERDFTGLRVAWMGDLGGYLPMEAGVLEQCTTALGVFERIGMTVQPYTGLPTAPGFAGTDDLWPLWLTFRHWLAGAQLHPLYRNPETRAALKPEALYEVEGLIEGVGGRPPIGALDVFDASVKRTAMYNAFLTLFDTYDFLVLPSAQVFPFEADMDWPRTVNATAMSSYHRWMEVTTIATLLGVPAVSLPAGFGPDGLPMGVQVLARSRAELDLLQVAHRWERESPWGPAVKPRLLK